MENCIKWLNYGPASLVGNKLHRFRMNILMKYNGCILFFCAATALHGLDRPIILDSVVVEIEGVASPEWVKKKLGLRRGMEIDEKVIEEALESLKEAGRYSSVKYRFESGSKNRQNLIVSLVVDSGYKPEPGKRIHIDRIEINGNWKTKPKVILGEFLFKEGDWVERKLIEESVQRVYNRDYFFEIDWGIYEENDETVIELRVREKWTLFPVIYFKGDSASKRLTMMIGALDGNFLGQGFFLMANYFGTFIEDELPEHDVQLRYVHRRIGARPLKLKVFTGTLTQLSYITEAGERTDAFSQNGFYIKSDLAYEWNKKWETSLVLNFTHDQFRNDHALKLGYDGFQMTQDAFGFGLRIGRNGINLRDQRRQGLLGEASAILWTPVSDTPYWHFLTQFQYHHVFLKDWLSLSTQFKAEYSTSAYPMFQVNQEEYLRGGSSQEYYNPLVIGANFEISVSPIRKRWLFLEIAVFCDLTWSGDGVSDSFQTGPKYRIGPGLRISFPPVSRLNFTLDFPFAENETSSFYFDMFRFF